MLVALLPRQSRLVASGSDQLLSSRPALLRMSCIVGDMQPVIHSWNIIVENLRTEGTIFLRHLEGAKRAQVTHYDHCPIFPPSVASPDAPMPNYRFGIAVLYSSMSSELAFEYLRSSFSQNFLALAGQIFVKSFLQFSSVNFSYC